MSAFTEAVGHQLKGVDSFSCGACAGCAECNMEQFGPATETDDREYLHACCLADEGFFSGSACDSCGSNMAGQRYPAHGFADGKIVHFDICCDCLQYHANGTEPEEWD